MVATRRQTCGSKGENIVTCTRIKSAVTTTAGSSIAAAIARP